MAVLVKTFRAIICDACLKRITEFEEKSAYNIRMERHIPQYSSKDFCKDCHPSKNRYKNEKNNI